MTGRESPFDLAPSGKTYLDEMREFAARMDPDVGPMFGRDVVRALDDLERLHRTLRAIHRNARSYHAMEDGKLRALNVIGNWAEDALAGGLHDSVEKLTHG
jgi:hypothetical protein